jgi:uncharacterized Zn-binding protein involved in type VI secretion
MPPAARVTDMHTCPMVTPGVPPIPHVGGPILPPGVPTVLIDFLPAATVTDMAMCVGPPDVIIKGSAGVFINFLPAARLGDQTAHGGVIVAGSPTCIIGEIGSPSPGAAGLGSVIAGLVLNGIIQPFEPDPSAYRTRGDGAADKSSPSKGSKDTNNTGFATQDAAAHAALNDANPKSIKVNREFGGLIYKDKSGKYHYSGPVQGGDQGVDPHKATVPQEATVVGDYHTHGDYSTADSNGKAVRTNDPSKDEFNSDNFSGTDKTGITHDGAGNPSYRGYLGTPSGKFLVYDPSTDTVSALK